jgi:hypothetical protein
VRTLVSLAALGACACLLWVVSTCQEGAGPRSRETPVGDTREGVEPSPARSRGGDRERAGRAGPATPRARYEIGGVVLSADGAASGPGVLVQALAVLWVGEPLADAETDGAGRFVLVLDEEEDRSRPFFECGPLAPFKLVASSRSTNERSQPVALSKHGLQAGTDGFMLRLESCSTVRGRVVTAAGEAVPGAIVRIDERWTQMLPHPGSPLKYTSRQSVRTREDGTFDVLASEGDVRVWARRQFGTYSGPVSATVERGGHAIDVGLVRLPAEAKVLSVRVVDSDGAPVLDAGAMLEYHEYVAAEDRASRRPPYWHLEFDRQGSGSLPYDPSRGLLVLAVGAPGFQVVTVCVDRGRVEGGIELELPRLRQVEVRFSAADTHDDLVLLAASLASVALVPDPNAASRSGPIVSVPSDAEQVELTWGEVAPAMRARAAAATRPKRDGTRVVVATETEGRAQLQVAVPLVGLLRLDIELDPTVHNTQCDVRLPPLRVCQLEDVGPERSRSTAVRVAPGHDVGALGDVRWPRTRGTGTLEWAPVWSRVDFDGQRTARLVTPVGLERLTVAFFDTRDRRRPPLHVPVDVPVDGLVRVE